MVRVRLSLLLATTLATGVLATPPVILARSAGRAQSLVLDALITHARTAGPRADRVGHRQLATGVLRDAAGRRVGRFSFTCTWTKVESDGALERCISAAWTADGRLDAAGPAKSESTAHQWRVTGGTRAFAGATGAALVRDLNDRESLISVSLTTRTGAPVKSGRDSHPAIDDAFRARANRLCRTAAARLAALPPFPFAAFDPVHPDASELPAVGRFFTGPGDPRPALRALRAGLRRLGRPPAELAGWRAVLAARAHQLAVADEQDRAALAADVAAFVKSVHDSSTGYRKIAITALVFGVPRCVV